MDPANYRKPAFAEKMDTSPVGTHQPVKKLACVATVYTMLAQGRGEPNKRIDDVYQYGQGAIPPPYVGGRQALDVAQILQSLRQRQPVVIQGEGGPLGEHSMLVIGFERTASRTTISALDPWPGTAAVGPGRSVKLALGSDSKSLQYPQLGVTFGVGYGLNSPRNPISPNPRVCYWGGWGGSLVVNDLDAGMTMAYVMNRMGQGTVGDDRAHTILRAVYASLDS
jgi:CubicO group peptidase (beta-lactamase class C family)